MSFDPETYNPFRYWDDRAEVHKRVSKAIFKGAKKAGLTPPPEPDYPLIDELSDQMAETTFFGRIGPLDCDPQARAMASETIAAYRLQVESPKLVGKTWIAGHKGIQHNWSLPQTTNRLYAIVAAAPKALIPLSNAWTWADVAAQYLSRYTECDVEVSIGCETHNATTVLGVKSGEFVTIHKCCQSCNDWFYDPDRENFRTRTFFDDFWNRR